jgi:hypothetical protein
VHLAAAGFNVGNQRLGATGTMRNSRQRQPSRLPKIAKYCTKFRVSGHRVYPFTSLHSRTALIDRYQ